MTVLLPITIDTDTSEYFVTRLEAKDALRLPAITPHLTRCVEAVNERLVKATGYMPAGSVVTENLDGGGCYLFLTYRPVTAVTSVYDVSAEDTLAAPDYELRGDYSDHVYRVGAASRWESGHCRYRVAYVAGTDSPPAGLRSVAVAMIAREYAVGQEGALGPMSQGEMDDLISDYYRIG